MRVGHERSFELEITCILCNAEPGQLAMPYRWYGEISAIYPPCLDGATVEMNYSTDYGAWVGVVDAPSCPHPLHLRVQSDPAIGTWCTLIWPDGCAPEQGPLFPQFHENHPFYLEIFTFGVNNACYPDEDLVFTMSWISYLPDCG